MSEFSLFGHDLFGDAVQQKPSGPIAERFTLPPFSVLDSRTGPWQERKRAWASLGIRGEVGRDAVVYQIGDNATYAATKNGTSGSASAMSKCGGFENRPTGTAGTSIFDPVLCELAYRWFSPAGGQIVDPFAGGSVRGIVAGLLGRRYWGCDLRPEQIEANEAQADEIAPAIRPAWACGDSAVMLAGAPLADMVFSCPPYGDLEKYSDDPRDLSAMDWRTFVDAYKAIVERSVARLRPNSFACFVVGDFRDGGGFYRNFVSTTIEAFEAAGARLYNEAILVTPVGTAAMRVTKQFVGGRKLAKTHQNVLVFCKGDWRKAAAVCE